MSSDHDQFATEEFAAIEAMRARIAGLEVERDRARRAAQTLGATVDRQCRAVLDATGLHHLIDESGDGDWGLVWERLAEMGADGWRPPAQVIRTKAELDALDFPCGIREITADPLEFYPLVWEMGFQTGWCRAGQRFDASDCTPSLPAQVLWDKTSEDAAPTETGDTE